MIYNDFMRNRQKVGLNWRILVPNHGNPIEFGRKIKVEFRSLKKNKYIRGGIYILLLFI